MSAYPRSDGYTLVELMVVVLIIGILVAIAIPVFVAPRAIAERKTCQSNQRAVEGAVQQYIAAHPANDVADCDGLVSGAHPLMAYFHDAPECPTSATAYTLAGGLTACPTAVHPHHTAAN